MRKKRKALALLEKVSITDAGAEGKAIAKVNDLVVFVPYAAPGDIVDIQLTAKKKNFAEGKVVHFHALSDKRVKPVCEHFGNCGGCKWQHLPYEEQLFYKQKQVTDNLTRLAKIELPQIMSILGSKKTLYYRNKLEFTFSSRKWLTEKDKHFLNKEEKKEDTEMNALGFHVPRYFDKVIDISHCHLQAEPSNTIRNTIKEYAIQHKLSFFDLRKQEGFLRNLIIRTSSSGEVMALLSFYYEDKENREKLLHFISEKFSKITSLLYVINPKHNDTIFDLEVKIYKGKPYIEEKMEGLTFRIGAKSFYQTNSEQAYELYKVVRNFATLKGDEIIYDLYTGTGTIANFIAREAKKVIGVDYIPEAIEDANTNAQLNKIENTRFYAGDIKDILTESFFTENKKPNVIITDPPRAGMHEDVVKKIIELAPEKIVYVSCNPATQARDLAWMDPHYKVTKIQPVDMFPHTHHVENVVLLERRPR